MLFGKRLGASARPIDFADSDLGFADEDGNVYTIEDETDAAARFCRSMSKQLIIQVIILSIGLVVGVLRVLCTLYRMLIRMTNAKQQSR